MRRGRAHKRNGPARRASDAFAHEGGVEMPPKKPSKIKRLAREKNREASS